MQDEASIQYTFNELGASSKSGRQRFDWRFRVALGGVAVNLIIVAMFAALFSATLNDLYKEQRKEVFVSHLTIDTKRLPDCPNETGVVHLPCLMKNGGYLTSHGARLGPWSCAHGHCPTSGDDTEIVIPEDGVYMVAAQTVVVDSLASPVTLLLSVNSKVHRACSMNSTGGRLSARLSGLNMSTISMQSGQNLPRISEERVQVPTVIQSEAVPPEPEPQPQQPEPPMMTPPAQQPPPAFEEYFVQPPPPPEEVFASFVAEAKRPPLSQDQELLMEGLRLSQQPQQPQQDSGSEIGDDYRPFTSLCPPNGATKKEAARAFAGLLELAKQRRVDLRQKRPYSELFVKAIDA